MNLILCVKEISKNKLLPCDLEEQWSVHWLEGKVKIGEKQVFQVKCKIAEIRRFEVIFRAVVFLYLCGFFQRKYSFIRGK